MAAGPPVKFRFCPAHRGEFAEAVAVGFVLTLTATVAVLEQPLELVTVKVYVPAFVEAAEDIAGLCNVELNVDGPDHE